MAGVGYGDLSILRDATTSWIEKGDEGSGAAMLTTPSLGNLTGLLNALVARNFTEDLFYLKGCNTFGVATYLERRYKARKCLLTLMLAH